MRRITLGGCERPADEHHPYVKQALTNHRNDIPFDEYKL